MRVKLADRVEQKRKCATRVFCFTLADIAEVAGKSVYAVKRAIYSGKLDPRDLKSIIEYGGKLNERSKQRAPENPGEKADGKTP